jgi:hypothetical protein
VCVQAHLRDETPLDVLINNGRRQRRTRSQESFHAWVEAKKQQEFERAERERIRREQEFLARLIVESEGDEWAGCRGACMFRELGVTSLSFDAQLCLAWCSDF